MVRPRRPTAPWLLALGFAAALNVLVWDYFIDDAYISFRYAENLATEGTLYYNKGEEGPPGYTNPLWVFLLAALRLASLGAVSYEVASRAVATLCLAAMIAPSLRAVFERRSTGWATAALGGLVLALFAFFPFLLPNVYSGLETAPFALCLFVMLRALDPEDRRGELWFLAALAAALCLRFDGVVVVLPLVAAYALAAWRRSAPRRIARLGWALLAAGLVYAVQLALAGPWVPLSLAQKRAGFSTGTFWSYAGFFLLVLAPLLAIAWRRTARRLLPLAVLWPLWVSLFYAFFMHWMFQRYSFPVALALFAALLAAVLALDPLPRRELAICALYALVAFPAGAFAGFSWVSGYRVSMEVPRRLATVMNAAELPAAHRTVATPDAGYVPYATDWRLLDLLGLTTPQVLAEGAGPAVGRLAPTVLILSAPNRSRPEELRLRSPGGAEAPIPPGYRLVAHLPLTNRYWWDELDYGYFVLVDRKASDALVQGIERVDVDVEEEMGWQTMAYKVFRRLATLGR